ncbi:MAG: TetR/AcrR family transcriptional regulator [Myxococcota bacterium]
MTGAPKSTKERIAQAALSVLRRHGSVGLSMRKVASEAGVSLGNLQYHYASREALLAGVVDHHFGLCQAALTRGLTKHRGDPLLAILTVSLTDQHVLEVARIFRELFALAEIDQGVRDKLRTYYADLCAGAVDQLLETRMASDTRQAQEVIAVLTTSIEGYYLVGDATGVDAEDMVSVLHRVALAMLAPLEGSPFETVQRA